MNKILKNILMEIIFSIYYFTSMYILSFVNIFLWMFGGMFYSNSDNNILFLIFFYFLPISLILWLLIKLGISSGKYFKTKKILLIYCCFILIYIFAIYLIITTNFGVSIVVFNTIFIISFLLGKYKK